MTPEQKSLLRVAGEIIRLKDENARALPPHPHYGKGNEELDRIIAAFPAWLITALSLSGSSSRAL